MATNSIDNAVIETLRMQRNKLEAENQQLKNDLYKMSASGTSLLEFQMRNDLLVHQRNKANEHAREQRAVADKARIEIQLLKQKRTELENENAELENENAALKRQISEEGEKKSVGEENRKITADYYTMDEKNKEIESLKTQVFLLNETIEKSKNEVIRYQGTMDDLRAKIMIDKTVAQLKDSNDRLVGDLSDMTDRYAESLETIAKLQAVQISKEPLTQPLVVLKPAKVVAKTVKTAKTAKTAKTVKTAVKRERSERPVRVQPERKARKLTEKKVATTKKKNKI